jgi:hypothetical protein
MAKSPGHGIKGEAQIEVKSVPHVGLVVYPDRKAKDLEICQRDADEASLKLYFGDHIV